ncbi:hypothetical protein Adeg_0755 [Ammonifex degensii KC4]|uniref:Uncharacterized protein n=1 Tax=Ammonifex degensii (strain DSM 10501 / KC4) TaxID=429009 RepID=C9RCC3_AMMDK|nr:hypothetical protein [Ammonifex degensii]ACX51900.1 hypothetical protein Adeg_0755 [Ammonifex degensii KC4]
MRGGAKKVYRLARGLRQMGFALCERQPRKLKLVVERSVEVAAGTFRSLPRVVAAVEEAGEGALARELRRTIREALGQLAREFGVEET